MIKFKKLLRETIEYLQGNWVSLDEMTGYWVTPSGKVLRVNSSHSTDLYTNSGMYAKLGVPVNKFDDGNEFVSWLIKHGWLQIRIWGGFVTVSVWRIKDSTRSLLARWAVGYPNKHYKVIIQEENSHYSEETTVQDLLLLY